MNRRDFFVQSAALGAGFSCVGMSAAQENASSTANSFTSFPCTNGEKTMKHKVIVTVIDKKLYPDLQRQY